MRLPAALILLSAVVPFIACSEDGTQPAPVAVEPAAAPPSEGLVLHVEADRGVSLSGSDLATWLDQSPFGNDGSPLSKAATVGQSLAGKPTLRFGGDAGPTVGAQGVSFQKQVPTLTGSTSFALLRIQDPGAPLNDIALSVPELRGLDSDEGTIGLRAVATEGALSLSYGSSGKHVETSLPALGRWALVAAVHGADGEVRLFADGTMIANGNVGAPSAMARSVVLSGGLTSAEAAALLVYRRALSDAERASVEKYVSERWQYR